MQRVAGFNIIVALAAFTGACVLGDIDLGGRACPCTDGFTCDVATNTCVPAGTSDTTSTSTTGGGGSSTSDGGNGAGGAADGGSGGSITGGGGGGGGAPPLLSKALEVFGSIESSAITLTVAEFFSLEADLSNQWQFGGYYDLASDPAVDLTGIPNESYTTVLVDLPVENSDFDWAGVEDASVLDTWIIDETPARFGLGVDLQYPAPGPSVTTVYWVYANGRVGMHMRFENNTAVTMQIEDAEYHYVTVNPHLAWTATDTDADHSTAFARVDGPAPVTTLQVVNLSSDTTLYGDTENDNRYWQFGDTTLMPGAGVDRYGALLLGPGAVDATTLDQRSKDLRVPGLEISEGATPVDSGFDEGMAAYVLSATASTVVFGVNADRPRFSPIFVIKNWHEPSWTIRLDGEEVVASDLLVGYGGLAHHDDTTGDLVFVYGGDIAQGTPASARTFTLEVP
ncbi:MAG: hypothetical protein HOW73_12625 [Polyangiaceae bacterium]|nr:hypothetical protein [Polyangiaceae bacterium]